MIKDDQAHELKRKAENYFAKGNLKRALEEFTKLKDLLPKDMRVVQKIGDIHHKLGENDLAKENYKIAAAFFTKEGYWAKAVALNKIIISLDPGDKEVQQTISEIYTSKGLSSQRLILTSTKAQQDSYKITTQPSLKDRTDIDSKDDIVDLTAEEIIEESHEIGFKVPLFSDLNADAMNDLLEKLAVRRIPKDSLICKEGEFGKSMFVISEGWVEIFTEPEGGKIILDSLKEGDFFGEFGLLTDGKRHASALAKTDLLLLEISSKNFDDLAKNYPHVPKVLDEYFKTRMFDNVLRKSQLFESLFSQERFNVMKNFQTISLNKGSFVFNEGDPGDKIFFIKNGDVEIMVNHKGDKVVVARLSSGDFFGEISLLTNKPRTASVRAASDLELLFLDSNSFTETLNKYPELGKKLFKKMEERAKDTIEAFQSHEEMKRCLGMV